MRPLARMRRAGVPMRERGTLSGSPVQACALRARRSLPFAGVELAWWDREGVALPRAGCMGSHPGHRPTAVRGFSSSDVWQCRSLQPALQRSHDERCPSGSGWGSGVSRPPARVEAHRKLRVDGRERLLAAKHASPWPVKPRLEPSTRPDGPTHLGLSGWAGGMGVSPHRHRLDRRRRSFFRWWIRRRARLRPSAGAATRSRGSEAGERELVFREDEDRAIPRVCSRAALVAEVDERRSVQPERPWV